MGQILALILVNLDIRYSLCYAICQSLFVFLFYVGAILHQHSVSKGYYAQYSYTPKIKSFIAQFRRNICICGNILEVRLPRYSGQLPRQYH